MLANDDRVHPIGMFQTAHDYLRACEELTEKRSDKPLINSELMKPRLFLIGHAFELAFKSILRAEGIVADKIKSDYGHDLKKILSKISENKWIAFSSDEKEYLELLNMNYSKKDFEYHKRGAKTYPAVSSLIDIANRVFPIIRAHLNRKFGED